MHVIKCWILLLTGLGRVLSLDVFIKATMDAHDESTTSVSSLANTTYEMPLFQIRYIVMRVNLDELRRDGQHHLVGIKFQVSSTDSRVIKARKEVRMPMKPNNTTQSNQVLLDDLYIRK
jgi:hypothetical protein